MDIMHIQNLIFEVRGQKIMLDVHLSDMYEQDTRTLKQAVNNIEQFGRR